MTESWYWVRDGQTRVDVDQLVGLGASAGRTAQAIAAATGALAGPVNVYSAGLRFDETWRLYTPVAGPFLVAVSQLQLLQQAAHQAAIRLASECEAHAQWLSVAAAIYAAAEGRALASVDAANSVFGLTPIGPTETGGAAVEANLSGTVAAVFKVPSVLADYWRQFKLRLDRPPTIGLLGEQQVRELAGLQVPQTAGQLAELWQEVGGITRGSAHGVLVMDMDGEVRASVAPFALFGVTKEVADPPTEQDKKRFDRAYRRLLSGTDRYAGAVETPVSPSSVLDRIEQSAGEGGAGEVQILKHTTRSGAVSWTVVLAGTRKWLPGSPNPQDMQSNLQAVAGEVSDQQVAATVAMDMAGIGPDEPVELVGHSQGGIVALALAANPHLARRYNFQSVLTAGSPTGTTKPPPDLPVLNLENLADPVPALDGQVATVTPNATTVYFDPRHQQTPAGATAHSPEVYVEALKQLEDADSTGAQAVRKWVQQRQQNLGFDQPVTSEALYFKSTRVQ